MPMNCWNTARPIATINAGRTHGSRSRLRPPSSFSTSWISSTFSSGDSSSAVTSSSTSRASPSSPVRTRKRGVSGMKNIPASRISEGTAASPSISRQSPDDARIALTMKAARMPITIIIWLSDEIAPRIWVGAISDR